MSYMRDKYDLGYTFALVPDPQGQTLYYPAVITAAYTYLAGSGPEQGQIVLTTGDLTQGATAEQLAIIGGLYDLLDAENIPYLATIGNHDYDDDGAGNRACTRFNGVFTQARYTGKSWWSGGFYEAGHTENAYCVVGGILYMSLEFGPRQAVLDWANAILTANAGTKAVIVTHSYMYRDGTRCGTGDNYNPHTYWSTDTHDGEEMWTELVKLHDNIILVCSGHDFDGAGNTAAKQQSTSDGGATITEALSNYQDATPNYGNGLMRFYKINQTLKSIKASTHSATVERYDAPNLWVASW